MNLVYLLCIMYVYNLDIIDLVKIIDNNFLFYFFRRKYNISFSN